MLKNRNFLTKKKATNEKFSINSRYFIHFGAHLPFGRLVQTVSTRNQRFALSKSFLLFDWCKFLVSGAIVAQQKLCISNVFGGSIMCNWRIFTTRFSIFDDENHRAFCRCNYFAFQQTKSFERIIFL